MTIVSAAHYLRLGYRIRRSSWKQGEFFSYTEAKRTDKTANFIQLLYNLMPFSIEDLLAENWEIVA
jgi:hypothetical protein